MNETTVPVTKSGALDAEYLLQPQGEARRLEAALRSFAERGFARAEYEAWRIDRGEGHAPAYGLRIKSAGGVWSPREWTVTCCLAEWGVGNGDEGYTPVPLSAPWIWTRGRTGEAVFEGGQYLARRLETALTYHLAVIGVREVMNGDESWLPNGWQIVGPSDDYDDDDYIVVDLESPEGCRMRFTDDDYGVGRITVQNSRPPSRWLMSVAYHVAGRLAGEGHG